jgi:hypothetical protein
VASEASISEALRIFSLWPPKVRENVETALLGATIARAASQSDELKRLSVVMDPSWAKMMEPILNAKPDEQKAYSGALKRLKELAKDREVPAGTVPTGVTVILFFKPTLPGDDKFIEYGYEAVRSRYSSDEPDLEFVQPLHVSEEAMPLPESPLTVDFAHVMYLEMVEGGYMNDYGKPSDGVDFTTSDGFPMIALFFWHGSEAGEEETKKKGLFRRR